jgi:hypothetical protein
MGGAGCAAATTSPWSSFRAGGRTSPNFALGHYTLAFVNSQTGDPKAAISSSDYSRRLSPFDPLLFGMLGARAMALVRLGRFEEAADWAVKAASRPNAHPHILAIAAYSLALAGSLDQARKWAATLRRAHPGYGIADFLAAFGSIRTARPCSAKAPSASWPDDRGPSRDPRFPSPARRKTPETCSF